MARPLPLPSPLTAPYWDACRRGELALQRCGGCRGFVHFPEAECPFCGDSNLAYEVVQGKGAVHTFTVVHRAFVPGLAPPYTVAWIDLDAGARVFGGVLGETRIGGRVDVTFRDVEGFGPMPYWRPDE
ncbi:Zn-ribbon domain-containing OB-fold protein [Bailinhaonella thermotolerans]|uniref:DNA-binding protein n=1 Tax=Bailinhaonella thermotolerans TaxID=1070861 RepID=A0A3A4ALG3_9ACTN|nr:OB-fold domain-containing protein [Bailinhaonella thermotolerans]RJL26633.1 hypothetical protein D5H75_27045 [Bailinhaonella thermotolerans]